MARKDFSNVANLSELADGYPTQKPVSSANDREAVALREAPAVSAPPPVARQVVEPATPPSTTPATSMATTIEEAGETPAPRPRPKPRAEEVAQLTLGLRKSLRKQLARLASDSDMTMRAFVLNALKEKGLAVRPDDLLDLRKSRYS